MSAYSERHKRRTRPQLVAAEICPECKVGELDTGWECLSCGFDARPEALITVGGQIVGHEPLHCESNGASDYCMHCGRDIIDLSPCSVLEALRLKQIPDDDVAAFGCHIEATSPPEGLRCEKWCHKADCPYTLYTSALTPEA